MITIIEPQTGPQEAFLSSPADIAIYAGAAGAGKTFAGLLSLAMGVHISEYGAIAFRRTQPELTGAGSIWTESARLFPSLGGVSRLSPVHEWIFPSGATIEMRSLQYDQSVIPHQSKRYAQILFEELTTFTEEQFWFMYGRLGSVSGVQPFMRATCNPEDNWVRELLVWWIDQDPESPTYGQISPARSGVLRWFVRDTDGNLDWSDDRADLESKWAHMEFTPKSMTAIRATIDDNQALLAKDPGIKSRLEMLPLVERRRKRYGDWNARKISGTLFKRTWFPRLQEAPRVLRRVRAWDKAASPVTAERKDPDWTRGVRLALLEDGRYLIEDVASIQGTPGQVDALMLETAEADTNAVQIAVWQDPGQAGVVDVEHTVKLLAPRGYRVKAERAQESKEAYAEVWSPLAERFRVLLPAEKGRWEEAFLREAESFPSKGGHDDIIDAASLAFRVIGGIDTFGPVVQPGPKTASWHLDTTKRVGVPTLRRGGWNSGSA
jgi:predicted phage terminase large subunit-like protein